MDDNKNINTEPLTKKEKADIAGRDVAEVAARGAGRYFGGSLGGAAVDAALKTKAGQKIVGQASKQINKNLITRNVLAKNQQNISRVKPIANSVVSSMGGTDSSAKSGIDNINNTYDEISNNDEIKDNGVVEGLFKKLPLKTKLIIIGVVAGLIFVVIFLIVLITPLMSLGIIDIEGIGGSSSIPSYSYSNVSDNTTYWWPIGSSETSTSGGIVFASGDPSYSTITSEFGPRLHPNTGALSTHTGVDIADGSTPGTTNVIAVKDGTVIYPSNNDIISCPTSYSLDGCGGGYGNYVMVQHSNGDVTLYAHLYENSITVRTGTVVKQGQVIGKMGSSGNSTGTHLHFEVRREGSARDPLGFVSVDKPRPKTSTVSYVGGNSDQQSVCLTLKAAGFSKNAVAALLTNIKHESSFDPTVVGDNGTSYGLCQWHNSRNADLRAAYPDSYHTIDSQINFLIYELENKYVSVHSALVDESSSVGDLTYKFCADFEIPYDTKNTCNNRKKESDSFYQYVINGCK